MMAKLKQRQEEGSSHGRSLAKCREANLTMINDDLVEVTVQNMDGEPDGTVGTLSERAYRAIEELVVTLQLPPGCKVSEKTLSARLGIGRTPIREALRKLATEGTVVVLPRAGVLVSEIDIPDQFKLIEVRRELEKIIAGRAARLATPDERTQFQALAAMFNEAAEKNDDRIFLSADREFNRLSAVVSHNKYALNDMAPLQAQTRRNKNHKNQQNKKQPKKNQQHTNNTNAISRGEENSARVASD